VAADRVQLVDGDGRTVLEGVAATRDGRPWGRELVVHGPGAADRVLAELPGWVLTAPPELGLELVSRGATLRRHAHVMVLDLAGWTPPPMSTPPGVRFVPCDRPADDLVAAHLAAYGPEHVDHHGETAEAARAELASLLDGQLVGALLPASRLAVDDAGDVVGGCLLNDVAPLPFVTDVFRDPARSPAGTGVALLTTALAAAAADGLPRIGLSVTDGNPAQRVYQRLGFTILRTEVSVVVPDHAR
jgi:ribosomal protein S18 acetylase RimI-like enzyme